MKKYISLVTGLVLFAASACTPSTPVVDKATPKTTTTPTAKSSEKPTTLAKTDEKLTVNIAWQDYKSSAGKFSIQVPSKPQEQSQEQKTTAGTIKLNVVIAEANNSGYFAGYADFPDRISNPADIQKGLGDLVKSSVANVKGEIKSEKEFLLGDVPCRDFEAIGKVQSTDVSMKGRFCLADNRLYQVFALGAKDKIAAADVDRFITSFKIDK